MRPPVLKAMPDERGIDTWTLSVALPSACCPVSGNPRPGSTILIFYHPQGLVLDELAIKPYLRRYVNGYKDDDGNIIERNMEGMIALIAQHCADAVGVPVGINANLIIKPHNHLSIIVRRKPGSEVAR